MRKPKRPCPHLGHRLRLRAKAIRGLDALETHEIAELLLFESIRRRNTNETAHRLIARFHSLLALLSAPPERLTAVCGVGPASAAWISSVLPAASRILTEDLLNGGPVNRFRLLPAADLRLNVMGEPGAVLTLDASSRLLSWQPVSDPDGLLRLLDRTEPEGDPEMRDPEAEYIPRPSPGDSVRRLLLLRRDDAERMLTGIPGALLLDVRILIMTRDHRLEER